MSPPHFVSPYATDHVVGGTPLSQVMTVVIINGGLYDPTGLSRGSLTCHLLKPRMLPGFLAMMRP